MVVDMKQLWATMISALVKLLPPNSPVHSRRQSRLLPGGKQRPLIIQPTLRTAGRRAEVLVGVHVQENGDAFKHCIAVCFQSGDEAQWLDRRIEVAVLSTLQQFDGLAVIGDAEFFERPFGPFRAGRWKLIK